MKDEATSRRAVRRGSVSQAYLLILGECREPRHERREVVDGGGLVVVRTASSRVISVAEAHAGGRL